MSPRIRTTKPLIATREKAESIAGELAALIIARDAQFAAMNRTINDIRAANEADLTYFAKAIEEKTDLLRAWSEANPDEYGQKKSIDFVHAVLGFRTGTPKLRTLMRRTWDAVLDNLRVFERLDFIRTKSEVAKDAILAAHSAGKLTDEDLKRFGVQIVQDEAFFFEPKLEQPAESK